MDEEETAKLVTEDSVSAASRRGVYVVWQVSGSEAHLFIYTAWWQASAEKS